MGYVRGFTEVDLISVFSFACWTWKPNLDEAYSRRHIWMNACVSSSTQNPTWNTFFVPFLILGGIMLQYALSILINLPLLAFAFSIRKTYSSVSSLCPNNAWEQGLQDSIQLVPIDLQNRPDWYKEKLYPPNKVPALEHNNKVQGESLNLIKYIDTHFEGPSLFPHDPAKKEFAEELMSFSDSFNSAVFSSFKGDEKEAYAAFDFVETALSKFEDGPFFLGNQFSLVDITYAPFLERFQHFLLDVKNYDIKEGRPKLAAFIEEVYKMEAYKQTRRDPKEYIVILRKRFLE